MFERAIKKATGYTQPYVGLRRKQDGSVHSNVGAFILLNSEGWCVTAKHIFDEIQQAQNSIDGVPAIETQLTGPRPVKWCMKPSAPASSLPLSRP